MSNLLRRSVDIQRQGLAAFVAQVAAASGENEIPERMTFLEWCLDLGARGLKVDGKPFRLDDRPALVPLYEAIPTTRAEAKRQTLVVMKATQLGLTIWEVLADVYMARKWAPVNIGLFLPDQATAGFKSEHRFMRIVRSAPDLYRPLIWRQDPDGPKKVGEGNVMTRAFGESLLLFLWTSGKVSTESRPMDVVSLDEVQGMSLEQIDKTQARMGDSEVRFSLMLSTANMPGADIHEWFNRGTQEVWHTECPRCGEMSDLSDPAGIFPGRSTTYRDAEFHWCCPACQGVILDPQRGRYISQNPAPQQGVRSLMLPRTISPKITAREMVTDFNNARTGNQKKSFYNRTLARPYIDADQLPVTLAACEKAAEEGVRLGLRWEKSGRDTFMGVDQMAGFNCHIIKRRLPDGRQAVVHVEASFGDNPFARTHALMDEFGVSVAVIEQLINANEARRFVNKFRKRAYMVAGWGGPNADMVSWGDDLTKSDKRTNEEDRDRFTVTPQQYKAMQASLYRIRDGHCLFPDPGALEQDVFEDGIQRRIPILREWVFDHFTKTALVVEQHPETRKAVARVEKVGGIDPHFAFANMLCDIAWSRSHGTGSIFIPATSAATQEAEATARRVEAAMPGLPANVVAMIAEPPPAGSCGHCLSFEEGRCTARNFLVQPGDAGCFLFTSKGS